jgi:mRNA interferase RelE/StbE
MWRLEYSKTFVKQARQLDKPILRRVSAYLDEIVASGDPRSRGRSLSSNLKGYWRYRVGDYRVIVKIKDSELVVIAAEIGHRSTIYN